MSPTCAPRDMYYVRRDPSSTSHLFIARSRFDRNHGTPVECLDFDLVIVVAHDDYNPYKANGLKAGLGDRDVSLLSWGLAQLQDSSRRYWTLNPDVNLEAVEANIREAVAAHVVPILRRTETLEEIISLYAERGRSAGYKPRSWALMQLGDVKAAQSVVRAAIDDAPNEKAKLHAQQWLANIDA